MIKDILLIDKPSNWTSFDVVAKVRGKVRAKYVAKGEKPTKRQLRVGHAGTLDPFATGLLIVLLGDACKNADQFLKLDKTYEFTAKLGQTSNTGDTEGVITEISETKPDTPTVIESLKQFEGIISQTPPIYSAIKVNGKRAYKLAREGLHVEIPSRKVTIKSLKLVSYEYPYVRCVCEVNSGTYIRSLVEDIGETLKTGAYCTELRRTRIGEYKIEDARTVESIT